MREVTLDPLSVRRVRAVAEVDDYFSCIKGAGRLPTDRLSQYRKCGYGVGWRAPVDFSDRIRRELHTLVDDGFPYTRARIAIANGPGTLVWPHLETGGFLCILPPDATVSSDDPVGVVSYVFGEACRLIEDSIHERNVEDFRLEFMNYWALAAHPRARRYISLLEPHGPGRRVAVWRGRATRVVGENEEVLDRWLGRRGVGMANRRGGPIGDGALIWLPEPLLPTEYPRTAADIRALARERSPAGLDVLESITASGASGVDVLLGAQTLNGACFAAVSLRSPQAGGAPGRTRNTVTRGFRPGKVPSHILIDRNLSGAAKVTKAIIERADHHWIHGRDRDTRQEKLRCLRVGVLGCGSLGASVARMLAQAGVGNLLLSDAELLDWPNLSRHELGAKSVRRAKSTELARVIQEAYPHLNEVIARHERVGPESTDLTDELMSCDLLISTMGNWSAEGFLNEVQHSNEGSPPILYGWVEPHAAAAHAVLVTHSGACLRCGMNDKGRPLEMVTTWENDDDRLQAPACGALFTPYGPAEIAWAHALLTEAAIDALFGAAEGGDHRVWIAPFGRVQEAGGSWARCWTEDVGDPGDGGITLRKTWQASTSCPVCNRYTRVA